MSETQSRAIEAPQEATIPINEFCAEVSRGKRQVELLAAFAHTERQANRHHDTRTNYRKRLSEMHRAPA